MSSLYRNCSRFNSTISISRISRRFSSSDAPRESIISASLLNDQTSQPLPPPAESSPRSSWRFLKYGLIAALTGGIAATGYATYAYTLDEVDQKTKSLRASTKYAIGDDATSLDKCQAYLRATATSVPAKLVDAYLDLRRLAEEQIKGFTEPTSDKLLPDLHPLEQHVFTLVLDLNETLIYSDWKRDRGWRTFKRPGVEAFLEYLAQFYEIVVYSDQLNMYVDPIVERLDTKHCIRYRLSRGETKYVNGKHYKDLSMLNRNPAKVIYISGHALESSLQPENSIEIKPWQGEPDDTALLDLIPFLEYVAKHSPGDIRTVLSSYKGCDIAKEFIERSKEHQRPKNQRLLGLNVGRGIHVKLRLRRSDRDEEFLPYHEVLDTMLHELCHNAHSPHNTSFYKLWDEIRKECEDLVNKGISGTGQGFDLPGRSVGGISHKPHHSSLRQVTLTAAENRARLKSLLPSGPKKIGGDNSIMAALSPGQAAAMAAERRLRDNIWCGSEFYDLTGEDECTYSLPKSSNKGPCSEISSTAYNELDMNVKSQKRKRESDGVSLPQSAKRERSSFIDLTDTASKNWSTCHSDKIPPNEVYHENLCGETSASSSLSSHDIMHESISGTWQCATCTLLNPQLAPICGLCTSEKPKMDKIKSSWWSCRFCTLENDVKMDKCEACGSWRYSYGPPVATSAPNLGT